MSHNQEQATAALAYANTIRIDRARLRAGIAAGDVRASRILEEMPDCMHGCGVFQFLTFLPHVGKRARAGSTSNAFVLLRRAKVAEVGHKRLDSLTDAQLERLTRVVRAHEDNRHPAERGLS